MTRPVPPRARRAGWVRAGLAIVAVLTLALAGPRPVAAQEPVAELSDVLVVPRAGAVEVWVRLSAPATFATLEIERPWRLVLDFAATRYRWRGGPLAPAQEPVRAIRGSQFTKDVARLVVELSAKTTYTIDQDREGLRIIFPAR